MLTETQQMFAWLDNDSAKIKELIYNKFGIYLKNEDNLKFYFDPEAGEYNLTYNNIIPSIANQLANWRTKEINVKSTNRLDYFDAIGAIDSVLQARKIVRLMCTILVHIFATEERTKFIYLRDGDDNLKDFILDPETGEVISYSFTYASVDYKYERVINKDTGLYDYIEEKKGEKETIIKKLDHEFLPCALISYSMPRNGYFDGVETSLLNAHNEMSIILNEEKQDASFNAFPERVITGVDAESMAGWTGGCGRINGVPSANADYIISEGKFNAKNYIDRYNEQVAIACGSVDIVPSKYFLEKTANPKSGEALKMELNNEVNAKIDFQGKIINDECELYYKIDAIRQTRNYKNVDINSKDQVELVYSEPLFYVDRDKEFDKLLKGVDSGIVSIKDAIKEYYNVEDNEALAIYERIKQERRETRVATIADIGI